MGPQVLEGDWRLYEDRPGKPGWIAEAEGSRLRFPLEFGAHPTLTVTFLRSYQNISNMHLQINGRKVLLSSRIKDRVSQSHTVFFNARHWEYISDEGNLHGLGIAPYSRLNADFVL